MSYGVRLRVWGEYAAFNRPEMKAERMSYEVMTPSAARGILEAIYWKPEIRWVIDSIHVLAPIRFTSIRRNEIGSKIPVKGTSGVNAAVQSGRGILGLAVDDERYRQQRAAAVLRDVNYGIVAHFELATSDGDANAASQKAEGKHLDVFRRRAEGGQCFHRPYLGCREFPAAFEWLERIPRCPDVLGGERDLGWMLYDIRYVDDPKGEIVEAHRGRRLRAEPRFFRAILRDGVLTVPSPEAVLR